MFRKRICQNGMRLFGLICVRVRLKVVSVNSVSSYQTVPTAIFDPNGGVIAEAPKNEPYMLVYDYTVPELSFGMRGRIENSNYFLGL